MYVNPFKNFQWDQKVNKLFYKKVKKRINHEKNVKLIVICNDLYVLSEMQRIG